MTVRRSPALFLHFTGHYIFHSKNRNVYCRALSFIFATLLSIAMLCPHLMYFNWKSTLFLYLTGLYIGDIKYKNTCRRIRTFAFAVLLVLTTIAYYCRSTYIATKIFSSFAVQRVEYAVLFGWEFQSLMAIMFVICWQRTGGVQFIEQDIQCNAGENCALKSKQLSRRMKNDTRFCVKIMFLVTLFGSGRILGSNVARVIRRGIGITDPTMGLHRFDFVYRFIGIYQLLLLNCVICYFVTSVRCLTFQLQSFNREFKELLRSPTKTHDLPDRLMSAFSSHKTLAKKVRKMDKMFRVFIFCMLVTGVPMAVFGAITLIRRDNLLSFVFAFYDFAFCTVQLIAFSIVPAQLHFELHKVPSSIYWGSAVWTQFDPEVFQIARTFTETVERLKAGLSFGGLVFIRKSSILMAFILIVPYVILSYQLYMESGKMTSYRNNAIQHNQDHCHEYLLLLRALNKTGFK